MADDMRTWLRERHGKRVKKMVEDARRPKPRLKFELSYWVVPEVGHGVVWMRGGPLERVWSEEEFVLWAENQTEEIWYMDWYREAKASPETWIERMV